MALFMSPSVHAVMRNNRWWVGVIVCAALEAALATFRPFYVQRIIDAATTQRPLQSLVVSFAVVALMVPLCRWGGSILASQSAWLATNTLRQQSGQAIFAQPLEFFRHHGVGELSERIDADSGQLHELFGDTSAQITHTVVVVLFVAYHTWQIDPRICMILLGYLGLSSALIAFIQRDNHSAWEAERVADAALYDTIEESFASITDVKAVGATSVLHQRLTPRLATLLQAHRAARMQSQRATIVATIVNAIGWMIAVIVGIWHYQHGGSIGDAVAILGYMALIAQPIEQIRGIIQALQQARGVLARIDALLVNPTPPITTGAELPSGALAITLDHVSFRYPTSSHDVLRDITMHVPAGTHVAIMGRTGSGKSTLIRLLSRNETTYTGTIHYHHHALSQISDASLRHRVAVISQEVDIFNASLRDNVTCFAPTYHDDAIVAALTTCGLAEFLHALPEGLDTRLGDGQRTLSPGEQQLLALTRVWLRDPGVILLDEASAHIDPLSEQRITQAFASLAQHRTVITIAHRLSTVRHADLIVVLADGVIVEHGAPHLLAQNPESHYAHLLASDFGATI